ncbi:MAG: hypothetical protein M1401_00265 [Chloroflexi bacterium]|nr:hypothetical protein [Chloroflexota bacterium]MCL5107315.1 hypothetical protein [Chloroflexota bacterium]
MGTLCVLSAGGDTKVEWDIDAAETVREAERIFRENANRGYAAFAVGGELESSRRIEKFDPAVSRIVQSPPIAGG